MTKVFKKIIALLLVLVSVFVLVSCNKEEEDTDKNISFYLWNSDGLMPEGFQDVIDLYNTTYAKDNGGYTLSFKFEGTNDTYKQNLNLYFTAQKKTYDVVFDAQWILLEQFAAQGYYYDLSSYFNNDKYPGLKKAFDADFLNSNKFSNGVYGIPITESFGDITVMYIRKDWRELCANDSSWVKPTSLSSNTCKASDLSDGIDNINEYEYYLYWVLAHKGEGTIPNNVVPFGCNKDGSYGPYDVLSTSEQASKLPGDYYKSGIKTGISITTNLFGSAYIDERTGEVEAATVDNLATTAANGLANYPAGFNTSDSSWMESFTTVRKWNVDGILGDVANETESVAKFKSGIAASVCQTISSFGEYEAAIQNVTKSAELEIFIYDAAMRNKAEGIQVTDYRAWNFLCIPKNVSEKKVQGIMKFFDWLFSCRENHDLFQYGIKGVHWDEAKDESGKYVENTYTTTGFEPYTFTSYLLTWNPTYIRLQYASDPKVLEYSEYMYNIKRYTPNLYTGFVFATIGRSEAVTVALSNPDIATANSGIVSYKLGLVNNPVATYQGYLDSLKNNTNLQNALQTIQQDLILQLNGYISSLGE